MIIKTFFLSPKEKCTSENIVVVMVVACIIEVIDALRDVRICGEESHSIYIIGALFHSKNNSKQDIVK